MYNIRFLFLEKPCLLQLHLTYEMKCIEQLGWFCRCAAVAEVHCLCDLDLCVIAAIYGGNW